MAFKGTKLSVGELIARAKAAPDPDWGAVYGHSLRHVAADEAASAAELVEQGSPLNDCWRFGILQTVDDYDSAVRRGGIELGAQVFEKEPQRTGSEEIDAAFAALAEHLARRDGWVIPAWALDPTRRTEHWYPVQLPIPYLHAEADRESPSAFRTRGIFISANSLNRA
jgi:hypothetical protein